MSVNEIRALEKSRRDAMVAGDVAVLTSLMDMEGWYCHGTGERQPAKEWLQVVAGKTIAYLDIGIEDENIVMFPETAIVTGVMSLKVRTSAGDIRTIKRQLVDVWIRRADGWRLGMYYGTALPPS